jgi:ribosomal protein S18 acetylase RimI-like enzyme
MSANLGKNYIFNYATNANLPILVKIARKIISKNYNAFLEKNVIKEYLKSEECDKEIIANINNCIIMKLENKIIGFSIILENKLHLIIKRKYQNKGHGTIMLKHIEEKTFERYSIIELQSFEKNNIANNFYEKNGWKISEKINNDNLEMNKYYKNKIINARVTDTASHLH